MRELSKEDVISFFKEHIAESESRHKLSCHVVSTCEGGAGHVESQDATEEHVSQADVRPVKDIVAFKASLPLYPLAQPFVSLDTLKRPEQP